MEERSIIAKLLWRHRKISKRYIKISVGKTYQLKVSGTKQKLNGLVVTNVVDNQFNNKGFVIAKSIGVANILCKYWEY